MEKKGWGSPIQSGKVFTGERISFAKRRQVTAGKGHSLSGVTKVARKKLGKGDALKTPRGATDRPRCLDP